ncbi:DUF6328 family protein [Naasia sp. SYSU D00948]|uniref:DUF6328 family protein n=1 Tax=Naasia sp. SYSU D00948 TaxID=2817379 RepID=UPI001B3118E3|nr:DUF6328 family protein [Naasia sp. SYSU D00948]
MSHDLRGPDLAGSRDETGRNETENERLDRNWNEILQELRVTQTGTQILTGFLLTLAFQPRFQDLDSFQVGVYLVLVAVATLATALGLGPVSLHRALFRKRRKDAVVNLADRLLQVVLIFVGLLITGVVLLVFDVVTSRTVAVVCAVVTAVVLLVVWLVLPFRHRPRS